MKLKKFIKENIYQTGISEDENINEIEKILEMHPELINIKFHDENDDPITCSIMMHKYRLFDVLLKHSNIIPNEKIMFFSAAQYLNQYVIRKLLEKNPQLIYSELNLNQSTPLHEALK
jgi:hypothetical protein